MVATVTPQLSENAVKILEERYLIRDEDGNLAEDPHRMFLRVAHAVARGEENFSNADPVGWSKKFYDQMASLKFLPNSPTLVNAGRGRGSLSACFCVSPEDNLESIMKVASDAAMIEKWGGGIGFGFSQLRQKGASIRTTHGVACGPVAVMKLYSKVGETLTQGSFRLGAHMGQLIVSHPDIREFIHVKDGGKDVTNFNISVQVTDAFMNAVKNDTDWHLTDPRSHATVEIVRARELWDEIVDSAWRTGDPGLAYIDTVWRTAPNPQLGKIQTSNPCGEEFLENYGNCCLGSINLGKFVDESFIMGVQWTSLEETIRTAVRFLDDVIEVNEFPLPELREMNLKTRRIGLGVMGWADMLTLMNIAYDSERALELAKEVGQFIRKIAWSESQKLGVERGSYPEWKEYHNNGTKFEPRRHSSVLTIAPTGTIARIADCSFGIEPYFALAWWSNILWKDQQGTSTKVLDAPWPIRRWVSQEILEAIANDPTFVPEGYIGEGYPTANKISLENHIKMQAVWQNECVTNSVSKTINMPESATKEDIAKAYMMAWELGCKGITIYRDNSRDMQVLETGVSNKEKPIAIERARLQEQPIGIERAMLRDNHNDKERAILSEKTEISKRQPGTGIKPNPSSELNFQSKPDTKSEPTTTSNPKGASEPNTASTPPTVSDIVKPRPEVVHGFTARIHAPEGKTNITINSDEDGPMEVFINVGRAGSDIAALAEGLGRLISLVLRINSPVSQQDRVHELIHQLSGIGGSRTMGFGPRRVLSLPDAIANVLSSRVLSLNVRPLNNASQDNITIYNGNLCPECGVAALQHTEGCIICTSCGYSAC